MKTIITTLRNKYNFYNAKKNGASGAELWQLLYAQARGFNSHEALSEAMIRGEEIPKTQYEIQQDLEHELSIRVDQELEYSN